MLVSKCKIYRKYNASEKGLARKRRYYQRLQERFNYKGDPEEMLTGLKLIEALQQGNYEVVKI